MAKRGKPMTERSLPWWQSGFDLEGVVGFLAGWLLGILLGMLWSPLFWIGFIPGIVILFATRTAERVSPEDSSLILAPCDGVIVSVEDVDPPEQLGLVGPHKRIRVSSSPFATNNIHAVTEGSIEHAERETGAAENFAALRPDTPGLEVLFFSLTGGVGKVGMRVATGGLGPRLVTKVDIGDHVPAGKTIATRRLGGWCDVYVPRGGATQVEPGRTLIGGETAIWRYGAAAAVPEPDDAEEDIFDDEDEPTELDADYAASPETTPPEVAEDVEEEVKTESDAATKSDDPAEMFARLRREASKISDEDD
ncbi:phosphatidylserine decarboxylase [Henriciella sp. AS95]|uniref:phosphatidylserine decarboxylase n=1 Tax=Henriciella sp. AS95 TaxID=3135782 RepID=UPI00317F35BF